MAETTSRSEHRAQLAAASRARQAAYNAKRKEQKRLAVLREAAETRHLEDTRNQQARLRAEFYEREAARRAA